MPTIARERAESLGVDVSRGQRRPLVARAARRGRRDASKRLLARHHLLALDDMGCQGGKRWARGAATAMFALGTGIALIDLLVKDTSGDAGLPPLLGGPGCFHAGLGSWRSQLWPRLRHYD